MKFYVAVALVVGTVIGAGVFSIPYAVAQSGLLIGMLTLALVGFASTLMTLYMGEVVLRTKKNMQFTSLAKKYLGKWGKWLMLLSMAIGIFGALTAYLVGIGQSLSFLLGGNPFWYSIAFFIAATPIVYYGLKAISGAELTLSIALVILFIIMSFILLPGVKMENISYINLSKAWIPYGVILFATIGYSIVPELKMTLGKHKEKMPKLIITAMLICLSVYALFSFASVGVYGEKIAEIATKTFDGTLGIIGDISAVIAMTTGFLALSTVLKDVFHIDLGLSKKTSWILVSFVPLAIVLIFSPSFATAVSLTGVYSGGLVGILSALMAKEARIKGDVKTKFVVPGGKWLMYFVIAIFITGMIYETIMLFI